MVDKATDRSTRFKVIIYIKYLNKDENGMEAELALSRFVPVLAPGPIPILPKWIGPRKNQGFNIDSVVRTDIT